ncbi:C4-dicarboxylate transporter DctM subunit [Kerstersia gyiorum]|uniref:TRAP transporter large permease protein n=1 Tax=Kerstersia gyiorum TaxID=206506 RepID=A0A4Q7MF10_9BURK|nr:TRAP transporter large permease [Kerstersia gyiorum]KAB0542506.1 TRAP transporter large permease [Kerstersia gyiorum]RZS66736.1 C4-dicarboxylate transporter DctM subunit [Kerstersia gyiorum]
MSFAIVGLFLAMLILGMPFAFAMGLAALLGTVLGGGLDALIQFPIIAYQMLNTSTFMALPLFILMGTLIFHGRIGDELFALASSFLGHIRGGLAISSVVACALFAAISSSSLATAATIGSIAVPAMLKAGYPRKLVFGPVAAGGTLGVLIPPSGVMILYGAVTEVSVGDLFLAGIVPGLILTLLFCGMTAFLFRNDTSLRPPKATWAERGAALKKAGWACFLSLSVLGGLYSGLFTPNEAGAFGVVMALIVTVLIKRTITWQQLPKVMLEGTKFSGFILGAIVASSLFNHLLIEMRVIESLTHFALSADVSQTTVLIIIAALLVFLGMFFEVSPLVLIISPVLFPIITAMGIDPVWFGVFLVVAIESAFLTPPVGMNLFIIQEIGRRYTNTTFREVLMSTSPYLFCLLAMLVLLLVFPGMTRVFL